MVEVCMCMCVCVSVICVCACVCVCVCVRVRVCGDAVLMRGGGGRLAHYTARERPHVGMGFALLNPLWAAAVIKLWCVCVCGGGGGWHARAAGAQPLRVGGAGRRPCWVIGGTWSCPQKNRSAPGSAAPSVLMN